MTTPCRARAPPRCMSWAPMARLTAEDLVELAQTKGEQHLLAISGRWWLTEIVTDALAMANLAPLASGVSLRRRQRPQTWLQR